MQYHKPNANMESGSQTVSIVSGYNGFSCLLVVGGGAWPRWRVSLLTMSMMKVL